MILHPYNRYSASARLLRRGLGRDCQMSYKVPIVRNQTIINWGDSDNDFLNRYPLVLNRPKVVTKLINKLRFFQHCVDGVVPWTTDPNKAKEWENVYCRQRLEGTGGEGIVLWRKSNEPLPEARLYTKRIFADREFRIHVGKTKDGFICLDIQRKVFQKSAENPNPKSWSVRSHENGFVFVRNDPPDKSVVDAVLNFVRVKFPDLDFAAFDVLVKGGRTYVLEGNTAPGLEGKTVEIYCNFFRSVL